MAQTTGVPEFGEIVSSVLTDGGNYLAVLVDKVVIHIPKVEVSGNDSNGLGKNHRGAAAGTLSVIGKQLRSVVATVGEPRLVSGVHDTILQSDWTHLERRE
jgi:hypothetical protein